jgi:hypothetical protein
MRAAPAASASASLAIALVVGAPSSTVAQATAPPVMAGLPRTINFTNAPRPGEYTYVATAGPNGLRVRAEAPYLTAIRSGSPVAAGSQFGSPFGYISPRLAFKIANTSKQTVYFTTLTAANIASTTDLTPAPVFADRTSGILVRNEGWGPLLEIAIAYADRPLADCAKPVVDGLGYLVQWSPRLDTVGQFSVVTPALRARHAPNVEACIVGVLGYKDAYGAAHRLPFRHVVYWGPVALPSIIEPSHSYALALQAGRSNYSQSIDVSQAVPPQGVDQFLVRFASDKSASFAFDARLTATDGATYGLGRVTIAYFRPRSATVKVPLDAYRTIIPGTTLPPELRTYFTAVGQLATASQFMKAGDANTDMIARTTDAWEVANRAAQQGAAADLVGFLRGAKPGGQRPFSICMVDGSGRCSYGLTSDGQ